MASNAAFQNKMFQFAQQLAAAVMRKIIFFGALAHGGALGGVVRGASDGAPGAPRLAMR